MKLNQNGSGSNLLAPLVVVSTIFFFTLVFAIWAFSNMQTYKNKSDQLVSKAVTQAKSEQLAVDNAQSAKNAQNPLATYYGPEAYGSLVLMYPKTWSSYVDDSAVNSNPIDGYFYPGTLPAVADDSSTNFPLRVQVVNSLYSQYVAQYSGQQGTTSVTIAPYSLPKVPSSVGVEVTGQLLNSEQGTAVILPDRNETLVVWTEGTQYLSDFSNVILANLSYSP